MTLTGSIKDQRGTLCASPSPKEWHTVGELCLKKNMYIQCCLISTPITSKVQRIPRSGASLTQALDVKSHWDRLSSSNADHHPNPSGRGEGSWMSPTWMVPPVIITVHLLVDEGMVCAATENHGWSTASFAAEPGQHSLDLYLTIQQPVICEPANHVKILC